MTAADADRPRPDFPEVAGVLVSPCGTPRLRRPGRRVDPDRPATELPAFGQVGYLAASDTELAMFRTSKLAVHPGPKGEPMTQVALNGMVSIELDERRLVSFLRLRFADDAEWTLQVGRINRDAARRFVAAVRPA